MTVPVMDLSGTVLDLASGSYTVTRTVPGTTGTDGRFEPGSSTPVTVTASVQPLSGRDLLRLPEGLRTKELIKIYSPTQLYVQGAGQDPDVISVRGVSYQIETAEQWGDDGSYWKMVARKVGRAAP
jgi:hypothetical protein